MSSRALAAVPLPAGGAVRLPARGALLLATLAIASCSRQPPKTATSLPKAAEPAGRATVAPAGQTTLAPLERAPAPPAARAGGAASATSSAPRTTQPSSAAVAGGPARTATLAPVSPSASPGANADMGLTGLLALGPRTRLMPEDFLIGSLAAPRDLSRDERAAFDAAAALFDGLVRGQVDRELLAASSREELAAMLDFAIEHAEVPTAWRLGPPHQVRSELACAARLIGTPGTAEGEVYLANEGGAWLVTDVQINPAQLAAPRPSQRRFFPSPYRWLLGE